MDYVIDIKTAFNILTFSTYIGSELSDQYWWQMQGYFDLTGFVKGEVSSCLISDQPEVIQSEIKRRREAGLEMPETDEEFITSVTFDDIPDSERRIIFHVERDDDAITRMHRRIKTCREYLHELEQKHLNPQFDGTIAETIPTTDPIRSVTSIKEEQQANSI